MRLLGKNFQASLRISRIGRMHFLEEVTKSEVVSPERRGSEPGSIAFERNIYFGHLVFHETVQIGADGSYRSHAAGSGERPASDFSMQIEEPEPGQLFIRFIYFEDRPEVPTAIETTIGR